MEKYVYEFEDNPCKLLHSGMINRIAAKITVDGVVTKNRYGETDTGKMTLDEFNKLSYDDQKKFMEEHPEYNKQYFVSYAIQINGKVTFNTMRLGAFDTHLTYGFDNKGALSQHFYDIIKDMIRNRGIRDFDVTIINFWKFE